mmetsp:Transcript_113954/g.198049  ORF Transcript_113954/g.198049 Transcript_113954/m.198049 type:complete len:85 (+) Transcript_113954:140-394(+)
MRQTYNWMPKWLHGLLVAASSYWCTEKHTPTHAHVHACVFGKNDAAPNPQVEIKLKVCNQQGFQHNHIYHTYILNANLSMLTSL